MKQIDINIKDNRGQILAELENRVQVALEAVGLEAEGDAKLELGNSPRRIDTGMLRNSITHARSGKPPSITSYRGDKPSKYDPNGIPSGSYSGTAQNDPKNQQAVYIGTNVEYAPYVHEGFYMPNGKFIAPNRFLKNAMEKNTKEYKEIIKEYLEK